MHHPLACFLALPLSIHGCLGPRIDARRFNQGPPHCVRLSIVVCMRLSFAKNNANDNYTLKVHFFVKSKCCIAAKLPAHCLAGHGELSQEPTTGLGHPLVLACNSKGYYRQRIIEFAAMLHRGSELWQSGLQPGQGLG